MRLLQAWHGEEPNRTLYRGQTKNPSRLLLDTVLLDTVLLDTVLLYTGCVV